MSAQAAVFFRVGWHGHAAYSDGFLWGEDAARSVWREAQAIMADARVWRYTVRPDGIRSSHEDVTDLVRALEADAQLETLGRGPCIDP